MTKCITSIARNLCGATSTEHTELLFIEPLKILQEVTTHSVIHTYWAISKTGTVTFKTKYRTTML